MSGVEGILAFVDAMGADELIATAKRIEALGYEEMWLPDLLGRDVFATAGFVLANTERLRVATGIANVYGRDATTTAQLAHTLAELHGGRFILGLGVSHPQAAELRGHTWIAPHTKLKSHLEEMARVTPRSPAPAKPAPVYIAAHGPKLLRLAAELADGANTYLMPPEHTREARAILGPDKALNVVLPCCLCTDAERARHVARKGLAVYLGLPAYHRQWKRFGLDEREFAEGASDRLVDTLVAWGDEQTIARRVDAYTAAGATRIEVIQYNPEGRGPHWPLLEALAPMPA
jgi:probable F420-dependent oxidoreductase